MLQATPGTYFLGGAPAPDPLGGGGLGALLGFGRNPFSSVLGRYPPVRRAEGLIPSPCS